MKTFNIAGRLGTTPELQSKGETVWTNLRVVVNGPKNRSDWFWITAFGKLAEALCEHLERGGSVALSGELRVSTYNETEKVELIAKEATFLGRKKS